MIDKSLYNCWLTKYNIACQNMKKSKKQKGILIEIAAQHPLIKGSTPNNEFKKRLDEGIELYKKLSTENIVKIYVPGSMHQENGKRDLISLSDAGKKYLIKHNIPKENIYADEANFEIMGEKGVYNSTDECYVSCCLFKKYKFKELHLICSPNQMMRKMLCYINFGFLPNIHTVSCENMYHNPINEIFECIPNVIYGNNTKENETRNNRRVK